MKLIGYLFIILFISSCTSEEISSEEMIKKLEVEGKSYFDDLVSTRKYESLLDKIESGDEILISGSSMLKQWADASTSLSLKYALSRAITKRPDSVMKLIPEHFSVAELCTIPYIEESIEIEKKHVRESLSALEGSTNPNDSHVECINIYKKISKNISKISNRR
jgi:hypothetical protein